MRAIKFLPLLLLALAVKSEAQRCARQLYLPSDYLPLGYGTLF